MPVTQKCAQQTRPLFKLLTGMFLMILSSAANAVEVLFIQHNQTSGSGAVSTLITDGSHTSGLYPASTAVWDWDGTTLSSTGLYVAGSSIGSSIYSSTVLGDEITDLSVDTSTSTATATAYNCLEGTFLQTVGASGCGGYQFGPTAMNDSTTIWGPGLAVTRTIAGDDDPTGVPRDITSYDFGLTETAGTGLNPGDRLIIGNGIPIGTENTGGEEMVFTVNPPDNFVNDDDVDVAANTTTEFDVLANDALFDSIVDLTVTDSTGGITPVVLRDSTDTCLPVETDPGPPPVIEPDPVCFPASKTRFTIQYTSAVGFSGADTFMYTVTDRIGPAETGMVTVSNQLPDAVDDAPVTPVDTTVVIDVLANDTLGDGPDLNVDVTSLPADGTIDTTVPVSCTDAMPANCSLSYTPNTGFTGFDSFVYELTDDNGDTDTATVSILVGDTLAAADDMAETERNPATVAIDVLDNDENTTNPDFTVDVTGMPGKGMVTTTLPVTCTATVGCTLTYAPGPGAGDVGDDSFVYEVTDNLGFSSMAVVSIFINDIPIPSSDETGDAINSPALPDEAITATLTPLDVLANDDGLNDTPITVNITTPPARGTAVFNAGSGNVDYTSDPGFVGQDTFEYSLTDSRGIGGPDTSGTTTTVTVDVDDKPDAVNDGAMGNAEFDVDVSTTQQLDVLFNDTGLSDTPITVTLENPMPMLGLVQVNTSCAGAAQSICIDYTAGNSIGMDDSFGYRITDSSGDTDTAVAWVNVVGELPMAVDDVAVTNQGVPVGIDVLANDTGLDGKTLTVTVEVDPADGTVGLPEGCTAKPGPCQLPYTPDPSFAGTDTFTYRVTDDANGQFSEAQVTITVNPIPLRAVLDEVETFTDETVAIDVLANDQGVGNSPSVTVSVASQPPNGSVDPDINGCNFEGGVCEVFYTPAPGFTGPDSFQYQVTDGLDTSIATVSVTVNPGPLAVDDQAETEGTNSVTIDVLANDLFIDNTPLTVERTTSPAEGTAVVNSDNTIEYTPPQTVSIESESFDYSVTDNDGRSSSATVTVTIGETLTESGNARFKDSSNALGPVGLALLGLVLGLRRRRR